MQSNAYTFFVGGYAEPGQPGIRKCRFHSDTGAFETLQENTELLNPSWLTRHPTLPVLYAVEEFGPEGRVAALDLSCGRIKKIGAWSTKGADPCHICLSPEGRHLLVSNYTGGSLAVFALDENGLPTVMTDFIQHRMPSEDVRKSIPTRQEGPHIHYSTFHGGCVYVNDLGMNRVVIYDWNEAEGRLSSTGRQIDFPEGSGPRHSVFSEDGKTLYVLCELSARIHVFQKGEKEGWQCVQSLPLIPDGFMDQAKYVWSLSAAIRIVSQNRLCISTRGYNSIAVYDIQKSGTISIRQNLSLPWRTPRDFDVIGKSLVIANQDGNCLSSAFWDDLQDCYVISTCTMDCLHPTCVCL